MENIKNEPSRLARLAVEILGAELIKEEEDKPAPAGAAAPASPGFITIKVNEDGAKSTHMHNLTSEQASYASMLINERNQINDYLFYVSELGDKRVLVESLSDRKTAKMVKCADASRYFTGGRRRIKGKIFKRLGKWFNCPGLLLSLTFAPELIGRAEAWRLCRVQAREFMNRVNRWRKRAGYSKAKFLSVIEAQPGTGYPHLHFVFPYLKYLAPLDFLVVTWGQECNSVDIKVRDSISPVSYICKYVTKLEGWSDLGLSYIWTNKTRLYSMSRDYILPDYSDKRVPAWVFRRTLTKAKAVSLVLNSLGGYETLQGCDDLAQEIIERSKN